MKTVKILVSFMAIVYRSESQKIILATTYQIICASSDLVGSSYDRPGFV